MSYDLSKNKVLKLDEKKMKGLLKGRLIRNTILFTLMVTLIVTGLLVDKNGLWYIVTGGFIGLFYTTLNYIFYIVLLVNGIKYAQINLTSTEITGRTTYNKPFRIHQDMIVSAKLEEASNFVKIKVRGIRKPIEFKYYFEEDSYAKLVKSLKIWRVKMEE